MITHEKELPENRTFNDNSKEKGKGKGKLDSLRKYIL